MYSRLGRWQAADDGTKATIIHLHAGWIEGILLSMEATPENVSTLAKAHEEENWQFRSFLKAADVSEEDMDKLFRETADHVWAKIDCTKCANCCKQVRAIFTREEVGKIAVHLGMTVEALIEAHLRPYRDDEHCETEQAKPEWEMRQVPCAFLKDNRCTVYDVRPNVCRKYPYLHEPGIVWRTMALLGRAETCPIVYEVLQDTKAAMSFTATNRGRKHMGDEEDSDYDDAEPLETFWHDSIDGFWESERGKALPVNSSLSSLILERFGFTVWQFEWVRPDELTCEMVARVLLEDIPTELDTDAQDYGKVPMVVAEYVKYLGDEYGLDEGQEIVRWIEEHASEIIAARDYMPEGPGPFIDAEVVRPIVNAQPKPGRNDPCPCGSGKKYKKCCGR